MVKYYRRKQAGTRENLRAGLVAGALATSVAAVSFYLARLFLSREVMEPGAGSQNPAQRTGPEDED